MTLTHSASGGGYNGVAIDDVVVTIEENDRTVHRGQPVHQTRTRSARAAGGSG